MAIALVLLPALICAALAQNEMPGEQRHMMGGMEDGMERPMMGEHFEPPYLFNVTEDADRAYREIFRDSQNLTKQEIENAIHAWAANYSLTAEVTEFETNRTDMKNEVLQNMTNAISQLSPAFSAVIAIYNNQSITWEETEEQIQAAIKTYTMEVRNLLRALFPKGGKMTRGGHGGGMGMMHHGGGMANGMSGMGGMGGMGGMNGMSGSMGSMGGMGGMGGNIGGMGGMGGMGSMGRMGGMTNPGMQQQRSGGMQISNMGQQATRPMMQSSGAMQGMSMGQQGMPMMQQGMQMQHSNPMQGMQMQNQMPSGQMQSMPMQSMPQLSIPVRFVPLQSDESSTIALQNFPLQFHVGLAEE